MQEQTKVNLTKETETSATLQKEKLYEH